MAYEFYITIEGTKQGKFKGESERQNHSTKLAGFYFQSTVSSPRDQATGQASGKRRHDPVVIRKKVGAASPQIAQALCSNEVLKSVLFEFVRTTKDGKEEIQYTVKLTNATISANRIYLPDVTGTEQKLDLSEEVQFTFQQIDWEHKIAKTMASDDWTK